jgi:hypothetical protein
VIGRAGRRSGSRLVAQITSTLAQTATPGPIRRATLSIIGVMGLAAFVLGFIGWTTLSTTDPTLRSDHVAVLYRTVQLFIGEDGGIFSVPWTLDIARIIAPLVIPLLGSVAVLGFAAKPLNRLGARTAVGHTVAIGPADRVGIHLSDATDDDSIEVHADSTDSPTLIGPMHVQVDLADPSWLARTSAPAARRIVIATGRDDENLQLLQHALDAGVRGEIDVETATSESQRWLAIALAESHPDADVRVLCLEASQRRSVVAQITSDSRLLTDPSAPCAVIGDAADIAVLASDLARELAIAHPSAVAAAHTIDPTTPLGTSRRFFVVGADDIDAVIVALDAHRDATAGLLHLFVGTHTVDDVARLANLVALVADDDSATAVRTAAQLASSRLDTQIFVRAADLREVPLPRVTVIDSDAESLRSASPDPVQQLARVLYEAKNTGADTIEWSRLRRDVRRQLVRDVKRLVTELPAVGFVVTAGHVTDDADLPRDEELDLIAGVLAAGGPVTDARREDAANLAHQLARTGLRLTRAGAAWPQRDDAVDVLPGTSVDVLAALVHDRYLDDLRLDGRLADDNPSHVPWDDLGIEVRMQNAHHVLHAVATLNTLGYRVVDADDPSVADLTRPLDADPPAADDTAHTDADAPSEATTPALTLVDTLPDEIVEDWARLEHTRWMAQKLGQGWVFGSIDDATAEPPTHPELVTWDALDESARDKRRRPVERLPEILLAGGWQIVRPAPTIVIAEPPAVA